MKMIPTTIPIVIAVFSRSSNLAGSAVSFFLRISVFRVSLVASRMSEPQHAEAGPDEHQAYGVQHRRRRGTAAGRAGRRFGCHRGIRVTGIELIAHLGLPTG